MPTMNPRINVTLSPSLDDLVGKFASVQRVSKASVVREFLEAVEPQLRQALALMEAAQGAKPNALRAVAADLANIVQAVEATQAMAMSVATGRTRDLVAEAQAIRGRRPARAQAAQRPGTVPAGAAKAAGRPALVSSKPAQDPPISNRGVKSGKAVHVSSVSGGSTS